MHRHFLAQKIVSYGDGGGIDNNIEDDYSNFISESLN